MAKEEERLCCLADGIASFFLEMLYTGFDENTSFFLYLLQELKRHIVFRQRKKEKAIKKVKSCF
jgi:hypothetical protein